MHAQHGQDVELQLDPFRDLDLRAPLAEVDVRELVRAPSRPWAASQVCHVQAPLGVALLVAAIHQACTSTKGSGHHDAGVKEPEEARELEEERQESRLEGGRDITSFDAGSSVPAAPDAAFVCLDGEFSEDRHEELHIDGQRSQLPARYRQTVAGNNGGQIRGRRKEGGGMTGPCRRREL
eukprot:1308791-Rhodomonas_salina.1